MDSDNPAARLYSILDKGKKIDGNSRCRDVWQGLLNVNTPEQALLISRLGKLMELPQKIIEIVQSEFPNQLKTCNHWSTQVDKAFMVQNLNDKWATFTNHIDAHALNFLSITTELLQTKLPTKLLNEDELNDIRDSINDLLKETMESDIPNEIKQYISRKLHELLLHVDEYRITGVQPIMDGMETILGHAFYDIEYRKCLSGTSLGEKLFDVLNKISSLVTVALGAPQLPGAFDNIAKLVQKLQ